MKNKPLILISSIITASLAFGVIAVSNVKKELNKANSLNTTYSMTLDSSNQLVDETPNNAEGDEYGKVLTHNGAEIHMRYSEGCTTNPADAFLTFYDGDYFYNDSPVYGLLSVEYRVDETVHMEYGYDVDDVSYAYDFGQEDRETH